MSVKSRVEKLEVRAGEIDPQCCQCSTMPNVSGWRLIYSPESESPVGVSSDAVVRCRVCGKVRPVLKVIYGVSERITDEVT